MGLFMLLPCISSQVLNLVSVPISPQYLQRGEIVPQPQALVGVGENIILPVHLPLKII